VPACLCKVKKMIAEIIKIAAIIIVLL
jgi:hypothetical protein